MQAAQRAPGRLPADFLAARAAMTVSAITAGARIMGVVRTLVLTGILGITFLGNTYASANALPNLLFEIVAGGALAASLLPALAGPAAGADPETVRRTANAVLNRALLVATPVVLGGMLLRQPLMAALTAQVRDPGIREQEIKLGGFLLALFLPQLWLYVIGVVLTAVLHAYRRFAFPALAPLLSSIVVTASYLLYGRVEGPRAGRLEAVSAAGRLILGLGTTLGVAVLSLCLLPAAGKLGYRWRPVLRMPAEVAGKIRALLLPAMVSVGSQQVFLGAVLVLANRVEGGVVAYQLAFTVLLVFWAVFPLPVATTMFPGLAAAALSDPAAFARHSAEGARRIMVITFGAAALMYAVAGPLAGLVVEVGAAGSDPGSRLMIAWAVAAFSPGLVGYGLYALFTRAAYAAGDGRSPALAALAGFGVGIGINVSFSLAFEGPALIAGLAGGFSIGVAVASIWLIGSFRRRAGAGAIAGAGPAAMRSLIAALAAGPAGGLLAGSTGGSGLISGLTRAGIAAALSAAVYLGVQASLGDPDTRRAASRAIGFMRRADSRAGS